MSFDKAIRAFKENGTQFISAQRDGAAWNTNAGLLNLAEGLRDLESTMTQLQRDLHTLSQHVQAIEARSRRG
jgi:hypothetical protein